MCRHLSIRDALPGLNQSDTLLKALMTKPGNPSEPEGDFPLDLSSQQTGGRKFQEILCSGRTCSTLGKVKRKRILFSLRLRKVGDNRMSILKETNGQAK